jgi:hypothetical protein
MTPTWHTARLTRFERPVRFFAGCHDDTADAERGPAHGEAIEAPVKGFGLLRDFARSPLVGEPACPRRSRLTRRAAPRRSPSCAEPARCASA